MAGFAHDFLIKLVAHFAPAAISAAPPTYSVKSDVCLSVILSAAAAPVIFALDRIENFSSIRSANFIPDRRVESHCLVNRGAHVVRVVHHSKGGLFGDLPMPTKQEVLDRARKPYQPDNGRTDSAQDIFSATAPELHAAATGGHREVQAGESGNRPDTRGQSGDEAARKPESGAGAGAGRRKFDQSVAPIALQSGAFRGATMRERTLAAFEFARQKFAQAVVRNQSDNVDIIIPVSGVKHALSGQVSPLTLAAVAKLDEIISSAEFVAAEPGKKGRNTVKEVRFYESDVTLDGEPKRLRIVVRVATNGTRYYDHFEAQEKAPVGQSGKQDAPDLIQPFAGAVPSEPGTVSSIVEPATESQGAQYGKKVARQEREVLIRRLQSDATVRQASGKPFKTEASAKEFSKQHELDDTHEAVKVEAGVVLKRLPEARRPSTIKAVSDNIQKIVDAEADVATRVDMMEFAGTRVRDDKVLASLLDLAPNPADMEPYQENWNRVFHAVAKNPAASDATKARAQRLYDVSTRSVTPRGAQTNDASVTNRNQAARADLAYQRQEVAFARAEKLGDAVKDAADSYENGESSIEQFESALDEAENVGAGEAATEFIKSLHQITQQTTIARPTNTTLTAVGTRR